MNNALSEIIFEIRWGNQDPIISGEIKNSPHYNILLGKFLEIFRKDFTYLETLPTAGMPEGLTRGSVQYRLRKSTSEKWPLVQLGPGVFTLNINQDNWEEFKSSIIKHAETFAKISEEFNLKNIKIKLVYIFAIEFDFEKENLAEFLKNKLKIEVSMGKNRNLDKMRTITFRTATLIDNPSGELVYIASEGKKTEAKAIVWQAQIESEFSQILKDKELLTWLDAANIEIKRWI